MVALEAKQSKSCPDSGLSPFEAKQSTDPCTVQSIVPRGVDVESDASVGVASVGVLSDASRLVPPPLPPPPFVRVHANKSQVETGVETKVVASETKAQAISTPGAKDLDASKSKPSPCKLNHAVHVPGGKQCQPPVESALGKRLASSQSSSASLTEVKAPVEVKSSTTEQKQVQRSCVVALMDICKLRHTAHKENPKQSTLSVCHSLGEAS